MDKRTCSIDGCDKPAKTRGWCGAHYMRWKTYGDPLGSAKPKPRKTCAVDDCDSPVRARGWCKPHWRRWKETGDVRADVPIEQHVRHAPGLLCAVEDCNEARHTKEWCSMHYARWFRHGDPLKTARIKGDDRARFESHVDRSDGPDACHPWTAAKDAEGYGLMTMRAATASGHTTTRGHIAAWELENGPRPEGSELDHECHNQAVRDGTCKPGKCPHRLCCNLRHIVLRLNRQEHYDATPSMAMRARPVGNRKLTDAQAHELVARLKDATSTEVAELALRFGISVSQARRIKRGKSWWWLADAA